MLACIRSASTSRPTIASASAAAAPHQRARQHRRLQVTIGEVEHRRRQPVERSVEDDERTPRAQHHRGVEHVLTGAAVVDPGPRTGNVGADDFGQGPDERYRQAARLRARRDDRLEIVGVDPAGGCDRDGRARGNQAFGRFGACERGLEIEHRLHERTRLEHREDLGGRHEAVEGRCGHGARSAASNDAAERC
jgi:hypothetical protein